MTPISRENNFNQALQVIFLITATTFCCGFLWAFGDSIMNLSSSNSQFTIEKIISDENFKISRSTALDKIRKNIYISASFRSGSSFLGSIFDQNPDFLYEWLFYFSK